MRKKRRSIFPIFILMMAVLFATKSTHASQLTLQRAKLNIIQGHLKKAKKILTSYPIKNKEQRMAKQYYLALINFLDQNFVQSYQLLNNKHFITPSSLVRTCLLQSLNLFILNQKERLKHFWPKCETQINQFSQSQLIWPRTLFAPKLTSDNSNTSHIFKGKPIDQISPKLLSIYLKMALFFGQQSEIIPRFKYFSQETLENPQLRELIGMNYYREGNIKKAYYALSKLKSSNALTFQANLSLFQNKYELAYAQFKEVLFKKPFSKNALDRLIPLSWKLSQWRDGQDFIKRVRINKTNINQIKLLNAAFQSMNENFLSSQQALDGIQGLEYNLERKRLSVYNKIKQQKAQESLDITLSLCKQKNGIHCWLLMTLYSWPNFQEKVYRDQVSIHQQVHKTAKELIGHKEKETLNDTPLFDQKRIEEYDNQLIKLIN